MMWRKNIYAKISLAFLLYLTPVSLAGCNQLQNTQENSQVSESPSPISQDSTEDVSLDNIIKSTYTLEKLININLIPSIQKIKFDRKNKKVKYPSNLKNSLDSANEEINNFQKFNQTYTKKLQKVNTKDKEEIREYAIRILANKIDPSLQKINNTIKPLNNGSLRPKNLNQNIAQIVNSLQQETALLKANTNKLIPLEIHFSNITNTEKENPNVPNNNFLTQMHIVILLVINSVILFMVVWIIIFIIKKLDSSQTDEHKNNGKNKIKNEETANSSLNADINNEKQRVNTDYNQIYAQIKTNLQNYIDNQVNHKVSPLKNRLQNLENSLNTKLFTSPQQSIPTKFNETNYEQGTDIIENKPTHPNQQTSPNQGHLEAPIPDFLAAYNNNPSSLSSSAIEVNVTEETLNHLRSGNDQNIVLETTNRGSYWIIKEGNYDYLVPRGNLNFNQQRYDTAQALFQCHSYQPSQKQKFHVTKAARVLPMSENIWQLKEKGILEFYSVDKHNPLSL